MLLFWKYKIGDFVREPYNITTTDKIISCSCGSLLIACFLISSVINPIIFYDNLKKKASLTTMLFKMLAVTDFVTIKDHKENNRNNPKCRLLNPTKPELGMISKNITEKST